MYTTLIIKKMKENKKHLPSSLNRDNGVEAEAKEVSRTAMQELIDYCNKEFEWFVKHSPEYGVVPKVIIKATELLELERTQIIDAYCEGCKNPGLYKTHTEKASDFYNSKYNK